MPPQRDKAPLVSVITAAYRAEHFIARCHESVSSQTLSDWEHIIVDDASPDGTATEVMRLARTDSRIRFRRLDTNGGPAVARNTAIEMARGKYIAFLDSDDRWLPEKLSRQIEFMERNDAPFSFTSYRVVDEEDRHLQDVRVPRHLDYRTFLKGSIIGCLTVIYDRERLGTRLMPFIRARQDYGLWLSIMRDGYAGNGLDECLAVYCRRKNSLSGNWLKMLAYNWRVFREADNRNPVTAAFLAVRLAFFAFRKRFWGRA